MRSTRNPKQWTTESRSLVMDYGKFLKVEQHSVSLPNGDTIPDWMWVDTPDFINVAAITDTGEWLLFHQTKYAIDVRLGTTTLAPVGGYIDRGESPSEAAARELFEETGYKALEMISLGNRDGVVVDANRGCGMCYLFLATGCTKDIEAVVVSDDLEDQLLLKLSSNELRDALFAGKFKLVTWEACISMALLYLKL